MINNRNLLIKLTKMLSTVLIQIYQEKQPRILNINLIMIKTLCKMNNLDLFMKRKFIPKLQFQLQII
jgi:hypothetical protein